VHFNEPVDLSSFQAGFSLFRVSDGADVPGASAAPGGDPGTLMRYTPAGALDAATDYGFIVDTQVEDTGGNPLLVVYRARFTTL